MRVWIDADATPRDVREIVFRASKRLAFEVVMVANQRMPAPVGNPLVSSVWVKGGPDEADKHIAEHADPGDVAVTQDIPLAAVLVGKGVHVLGQRGEVYTEENVGERLSVRDFMTSLRDNGVQTGGPMPYGNKEKQAFASALDRTLMAIAKRGA